LRQDAFVANGGVYGAWCGSDQEAGSDVAADGAGTCRQRDADSGVLREASVKEPGFYWWRAELARRDAKTTTAFVPVVVKTPTASDRVEGITIELRGGRVLRLPASLAMGDVAALVQAIEATCGRGRHDSIRQRKCVAGDDAGGHAQEV
jgi:hypothetical protein